MTQTKERKKKRNKPSGFKRLPKGPAGGVELLLIQYVEHLGSQGDVVEVKPGYAHNYLIPQGYATLATDHHKRMVEKHKEALAEMERDRIAKLNNTAERLADLSLSIDAKANEEGHLYGSVAEAEIIVALKKAGVSLNKDQIKLAGPLKEVGRYTIKINLGRGVTADLKVWVVPIAEEE